MRCAALIFITVLLRAQVALGDDAEKAAQLVLDQLKKHGTHSPKSPNRAAGARFRFGIFEGAKRLGALYMGVPQEQKDPTSPNTPWRVVQVVTVGNQRHTFKAEVLLSKNLQVLTRTAVTARYVGKRVGYVEEVKLRTFGPDWVLDYDQVKSGKETKLSKKLKASFPNHGSAATTFLFMESLDTSRAGKYRLHGLHVPTADQVAAGQSPRKKIIDFVIEEKTSTLKLFGKTLRTRKAQILEDGKVIWNLTVQARRPGVPAYAILEMQQPDLPFKFLRAHPKSDDRLTKNLAEPKKCHVLAGEKWTDTGIDVTAGQVMHINASGEATIDTKKGVKCGGAGVKGKYPFWKEWRLVRTAPVGCLLGSIGRSGAPFVVGKRARIVASASGRLYLGLNKSYVKACSGGLDVRIHDK